MHEFRRLAWRALAAVSGVALCAMAACSGGESDRSDEKAAVAAFVSIPPQAFFVEKIGGPRVTVRVMVGPGQAPHTFEPTPRQLVGLSEARVYFAIGVAFEKALLARIARSFDNVEIVDTRVGIEPRVMAHDHGHGGPAPHGWTQEEGNDPHVWLSPRLSVTMAGNIRDALIALDPPHESDYRENFARLEEELRDLDARIAELLAPYRGREILVFHPAYGYFTDAYGLSQTAIEENGGMPGPKHLAEVIERAKTAGTNTVFVQREISATYAQTVADAIGGRVVTLDPLARDYPENMMDISRKIARSFDSARQ